MTPSVVSARFSNIVQGRTAGNMFPYIRGATLYREQNGDAAVAWLPRPPDLPEHPDLPPSSFFVYPGHGHRFCQLSHLPQGNIQYHPAGPILTGRFLCEAPGVGKILFGIESGLLHFYTPEGRPLPGILEALEGDPAIEALSTTGWFYLLPQPHRVVAQMEILDGSGDQFLFALPENETDWTSIRILRKKKSGEREELTAMEVALHGFDIAGREPGVVTHIHTLSGSFYLDSPNDPRDQFEPFDGKKRIPLRRLTSSEETLLL